MRPYDEGRRLHQLPRSQGYGGWLVPKLGTNTVIANGVLLNSDGHPCALVNGDGPPCVLLNGDGPPCVLLNGDGPPCVLLNGDGHPCVLLNSDGHPCALVNGDKLRAHMVHWHTGPIVCLLV